MALLKGESGVRNLRDRDLRKRRKEGEDPGFRLIPKNFQLDDELRPFAGEMSTRTGATIFVNLAHLACPRNRHARSFYIWCCGFAEIVRWGAVSPSDQLSRDRLLASYQGCSVSGRPILHDSHLAWTDVRAPSVEKFTVWGRVTRTASKSGCHPGFLWPSLRVRFGPSKRVATRLRRLRPTMTRSPGDLPKLTASILLAQPWIATWA